MRVFLAGATGVIGRRIVPQLTALGHHVTAATRHPHLADRLRAQGAVPCVLDVLDSDAVVSAVRDAAPHAVMHQLTDLGGRDSAANAALRRDGTRNLVTAARAAGVRRVVAQSIAWAYQPGEHPAREDEPLDVDADEPRRTTVLAIAALEQAVREVPEPVLLRYGLFYGPETWYSPDGAVADDVRAGRIFATADVSSFVHVDDAASAAVQALDWPSDAVNICDDDPAPAASWLPVFCRWVGAPEPPGDPRPRQPWARGADNAAARRLGWAPRFTSWKDGFADDHRQG